MEGRLLCAEAAAAGAKMNKAKIVKIAVVLLLLLTATAVSVACCDTEELRAILSSRDAFLAFCVVTHLMTICLLAWYTATAPTLASRRSYARATMASSVQLTANLYLALAHREEVQDAAAA